MVSHLERHPCGVLWEVEDSCRVFGCWVGWESESGDGFLPDRVPPFGGDWFAERDEDVPVRVVVTMLPCGVGAVGEAVESGLLKSFPVQVCDKGMNGEDVGVASAGARDVGDGRIEVAFGFVVSFLVMVEQVNELHPVIGVWFGPA